MTTEEKKQLKEKIQQAIAQTKADIERLEKITQPIAPENSIGRISRMDAINNKSVAEAGLRNAKYKLSKLQTALMQINGPSFGVCTRCKRNIARARLMYMPESTKCIRCAN